MAAAAAAVVVSLVPGTVLWLWLHIHSSLVEGKIWINACTAVAVVATYTHIHTHTQRKSTTNSVPSW